MTNVTVMFICSMYVLMIRKMLSVPQRRSRADTDNKITFISQITGADRIQRVCNLQLTDVDRFIARRREMTTIA